MTEWILRPIWPSIIQGLFNFQCKFNFTFSSVQFNSALYWRHLKVFHTGHKQVECSPIILQFNPIHSKWVQSHLWLVRVRLKKNKKWVWLKYKNQLNFTRSWLQFIKPKHRSPVGHGKFYMPILLHPPSTYTPLCPIFAPYIVPGAALHMLKFLETLS